MRKNIFTKIFMAIFVIALMTGCSNKGDNVDNTQDLPKVEDTEKDNGVSDEIIDGNDEGTNEEPSNQGITVNQINFKVIDSSTLLEELRNEIEILKLQKGYQFWKQDDGSFFILISAGEKNTGGYGIEVESIEDNEGKTIVSVKETEPAEGDMNLQALTYPFVVVKASEITDQFMIRDQDQNEYTLINLDEISVEDPNNLAGGTRLSADEGGIDYSKPIIGVYKGQMDNNSIEVLVDDTYVAFFAIDITQYLKGIEEGDTIEITAEVSPSDQIVVNNIEKVE
jgi:hypothetical protein